MNCGYNILMMALLKMLIVDYELLFGGGKGKFE